MDVIMEMDDAPGRIKDPDHCAGWSTEEKIKNARWLKQLILSDHMRARHYREDAEIIETESLRVPHLGAEELRHKAENDEASMRLKRRELKNLLRSCSDDEYARVCREARLPEALTRR